MNSRQFSNDLFFLRGDINLSKSIVKQSVVLKINCSAKACLIPFNRIISFEREYPYSGLNDNRPVCIDSEILCDDIKIIFHEGLREWNESAVIRLMDDLIDAFERDGWSLSE